MKMSSITSQPIAIRPVGLCRSSLSTSTRVSTTVLATESASPKTIPADQLPAECGRGRRPSRVAIVLWQIAPAIATVRTASRSFR